MEKFDYKRLSLHSSRDYSISRSSKNILLLWQSMLVDTIIICGSRGYPAQYGGFETLAQEVAESLGQRGFSTIVTGFSSELNSSVEISEKNSKGVTSVNVRFTGWFRLANMFSTIKATRIALKKSKVQGAIVLNDVNFLTALYLQKKLKLPVVIHLDGDESIRRGIPLPGKLLHKAMRWLSLEFIEKIVVDSRVLLEDIEIRHQSKVAVIKYGATNIFDDREAINNFESELPERFFLNIARLVPENNVAEIMQAYLASKRQIPLVVIGKGTGIEKYENELQELVRISQGKIFLLNAEYNPRIIISLIDRCSLYIHGHEAGGTNPILVTARKYAPRLASHENRFNLEDSRIDEIFWSTPFQLTQIMDSHSILLSKENLPIMNVHSVESWEEISGKYYDLLFLD